jgi:hypothetical protein
LIYDTFSDFADLTDVAMNEYGNEKNGIYVGSGAYKNCSSLAKLIFFGRDKLPKVNFSADAFTNVPMKNVTIYVKSESIKEMINQYIEANPNNPIKDATIELYPVPVEWSDEISVNGEENNVSTTEIALEFDTDPGTLTSADIKVTGATLTGMSGIGHRRVLSISNITADEVGVDFSGYNENDDVYEIIPATQKTAVNRAPSQNDIVTWTGLTADGTANAADTTELTLTFDADPEGLTADHVTVTGAEKGSLTGTGNTRTLTISDISVGEGENVTVTITSPEGIEIAPSSMTAAVHRAPVKVTWSLSANGTSGTTDTNALTLEFSENPQALTASDITVVGATKGELSGPGTKTWTLAISDIEVHDGENITVTLTSPAGYSISPALKTVAVNRATAAWTGLTANGAANAEDTTELTLEFDKDPAGLTEEHVSVDGAIKGELSETGNSRTLGISGITVKEGEEVSVYITSNPPGLDITPITRGVAVHRRADAALSITTAALPDAIVGKDYSQTLAAAGASPITWSLPEGSLPDGLTLSPAGDITGKPVKSGDFAFSVRAAAGSLEASKDLAIKVLDIKAPGAPAKLVAEPGDKSVAVSWDVPADSGGGNISRYEAAVSGDAVWSAASGKSHKFTGLTNGTAYTFLVRAVNEYGPGTPASVSGTPAAKATSGDNSQQGGTDESRYAVSVPVFVPDYDDVEPAVSVDKFGSKAEIPSALRDVTVVMYGTVVADKNAIVSGLGVNESAVDTDGGEIIPLPVFEAEVSEPGNTAVVMLTVPDMSDYDGAEVSEIVVIKLMPDGGAEILKRSPSLEGITDGQFLLTDKDGKKLATNAVIDESETYRLAVAIADGGDYDWDGAKDGYALDPAALALRKQAADSTATAKNRGGSGGCDAGAIALAALALALAAARRGRR